MSARIISDDTPKPKEEEAEKKTERAKPVFWWEFVPKDLQDQLQKYPDNQFLRNCILKLCPEATKADSLVAWLQDTPVPEAILKTRQSELKANSSLSTANALPSLIPEEDTFALNYTIEREIKGVEYFHRTDTSYRRINRHPHLYVGMPDQLIRDSLTIFVGENMHAGQETYYENGDQEYDDTEDTEVDEDAFLSAESLEEFILQVREYERTHPQAVAAEANR